MSDFGAIIYAKFTVPAVPPAEATVLTDSDLQVTDYTKAADGVFDAVGNRVGTKIVFNCQGEISAASESALAAALAAFEAFAASDWADFAIVGASGNLEELLAADCPAGTRVKFAYGNEAGPLYREVSFSVEGVKAVDADDDGVLSDLIKVSQSTNVEGLKVRTYSGRVMTCGDLTASDHIASVLPVCPAGWQQTSKYDVNESDTEGTYEAVQTELAAVYPVAVNPQTGVIVDGEKRVSTSYDEHNRKVVNYQYDYTGSFAQQYIAAQHTALRAAGGLMRAEMSYTVHKTISASGRFDVLAGRDGTNLLEMVEQISHARTGPLLKELRYPGIDPVILVDDSAAYVYEQSGRAIGKGQYPAVPGYKFASASLCETPDIGYRHTNGTEFETTWRFRYLFATAQTQQFPSTTTTLI
jgi:hypothetical protein